MANPKRQDMSFHEVSSHLTFRFFLSNDVNLGLKKKQKHSDAKAAKFGVIFG